MEKVLVFIRINYTKNIRITDIAAYAGIDSKYLCALFKDSLQTSPRKYVIQTRMDKACELMQNVELALGDIARSVGYQDPLLFSKMFKKLKGMSPREYRKATFPSY